MSLLPKDAQKIEVVGSTVDFFTYENEGIIYYYFDSSMTAVPEPMVNAMAGLRLLDCKNKKLKMLNHTVPAGLFPKIEGHFTFEIEELENNYLITFSFIEEKSAQADLTQTHCDG